MTHEELLKKIDELVNTDFVSEYLTDPLELYSSIVHGDTEDLGEPWSSMSIVPNEDPELESDRVLLALPMLLRAIQNYVIKRMPETSVDRLPESIDDLLRAAAFLVFEITNLPRQASNPVRFTLETPDESEVIDDGDIIVER